VLYELNIPHMDNVVKNRKRWFKCQNGICKNVNVRCLLSLWIFVFFRFSSSFLSFLCSTLLWTYLWNKWM